MGLALRSLAPTTRRRKHRLSFRRLERALSASDADVDPVGEDIGLEAHPETDQFLRLDAGRGRVRMGAAKDKLTFEKEVSDGWCVLVPAGTWHNITNIGATPMQVYTIYSPAHHKPGKVQATATAAQADKDDEPAAWSVQPKHAPDKHG